MKASHWRNGLWTSAVLLLGGGLTFFLLVGKPSPEPQAPLEILPPSVDVIIASPGAEAISVETQGSVRPLREISLVSQVAGRVDLQPVENGAHTIRLDHTQRACLQQVRVDEVG